MFNRYKAYIRYQRIKLLHKQNMIVNDLLSWYDPDYVDIKDHPNNSVHLNLNEFYDLYKFDADKAKFEMYQIYVNKLAKLKVQVNKNLVNNNCRLTVEQINDLEQIKTNLKNYANL